MANKACSVDGCESTAIARGWCHKHYAKWQRHGDPEWSRPVKTTCSQEGCTRWTVGRGLCEAHYSQLVRAPKRRAKLAESKAGRICGWCGTPIATDRSARAKFCSRDCKEQERTTSGRQREAVLRSYYKRKYGLTQDQVEEMRGRGCDICGAETGEGRWGQLHIDHCHDTGRVRGVLCTYCNTGLGHFKDDPVRLAAAIAYLEAAPMT